MFCGVHLNLFFFFKSSLSFKETMGQQELQQGDRGDPEGESCPAGRSQLLSGGDDSKPNSPLAAPHHHFYLCYTAALWHQCCELLCNTLNK